MNFGIILIKQNKMKPIQNLLQESHITRGPKINSGGEGSSEYQAMGFNKQRMFNISKSIALKHLQPMSGRKAYQDEKENKIQNQSNELLSKILQKLSERQNQRDEKLEQLNQNMNKLVKLFVEKWTEPEQLRKYNQKDNQNIIIKDRNQQKSQAYSSDYPPEFESRLNVISVKLPPQKSSRSQILVWVGKMCKKVLSVGFKLYKNDELDIKKVKVFCSENILRNLIQLPKQIKEEHWEAIDNCLKTELYPYFSLSYPQTQEKGVSKLSKMLVEKDIMNQNENKNDLVLLSGVKFDLQEDQNYNPQIMSFLNYVVSLPNFLPGLIENKSYDNKSLNKLFKSDMEKIFEFVQENQNVSAVEKLIPRMIEKQRIKDEYCLKYIQKHFSVKKQEKIKGQVINMDDIKEYAIDIKKIQDLSSNQKYRQKVKLYTSHEIGQKLPQNLELFSEYEIQNGNIKLNNTALMRVVTKWCQELEKCFNPNEIINRQNPWKMKDGSENYMKKYRMIALNSLLQREKEIINRKLKEIRKNNYDNQIEFSNREIHNELKKFSEEEAIVGQFSSSVFKTNETYLIKYLNMLIHGINSALMHFQKYQIAQSIYHTCEHQFLQVKHVQNLKQIDEAVKKLDRYNQLQKNKYEALQLTPQLITFKIGDLLRCKCTSKEYEITALYKLVEYLSHTKPQFIRILRIKNRLNQGNKDILMNILYRESMVVEMQLAIKSNKSKFIECSNNFNHYLYELERSKFGPIMEMCSIWSSQDQRSKFYLSKIEENNKRDKTRKPQQCCLQPYNTNINLPFKCQVCSYTYYECNFYQKHSQCDQCNKNVCCLCQFEQADQKMKKNMFPTLKQNKELIKENLRTCSELPKNGGILLNINSKQKKMKIFKPIIDNKECHLFSYALKDQKEQLQVVEKFTFKQKQGEGGQQKKLRQQKQLQEWFQGLIIKNLVFQYPLLQEKYQKLDWKQAQKQYFIPRYFAKIAKSQKKSVALIKKEVSQDFFSSIESSISSVQKINFSENKLVELKTLNQKFPNTQLAVMTSNSINEIKISDVDKWSRSLTQLYIDNNNLKDLSWVAEMDKLVELNLTSNPIQQVPEEIFNKLTSLKVLNLSFNKLRKFLTKNETNQNPVNLSSLEELNLSYNLLGSLPESLANLPNLSKLNLQNIELTNLPESFGNMSNLTELNLRLNQLTQLPNSFGNLKKLSKLNLQRNKLSKLPQTFTNLQNLCQLNLNQNQITILDPQFGKLSALEILKIKLNHINDLPGSFKDLKKLSELDISQNELNQLPFAFGNLCNLRKLNLNENKLRNLPDSFGNLHNLTQLYINSNKKFKSLPDSFGNLHNLSTFQANDNQLQNLPKSFGNLQNLELLHLIGNDLTQLPVQFGNLKKLRILQIIGYFRQFPKCLLELYSLEQLEINQNLQEERDFEQLQVRKINGRVRRRR